MSPRQSGGRYTPGSPIESRSGSLIHDATVAIDDTPPYQYGRKTWSGGGLPGSGSATPERTIAFSTTILDSVIPFVYGERKVTGLCAGRGDWIGQFRPMAFIFAFGEQDSITDLRINGELASGLSWVAGITYRYGTGAETIPTGFTQFGTNADWAKYAYVCFTINTFEADVPGSLDVTAVLGGQKCYNPFTTVTEVTSNPVVIAYDIQTNANWKGLASTRIDVDQWEPVADWCDDAMGDATARYEFNGVVYQRDPEAAVAEVLGHCFASMYFGADGKLRIWSEMDPPAITGEWSAAASETITEDSTAGEATTELVVGSIVYVGTDVRTVVSITDDDTVVLDSAVTASGATVRKTSGVYIRKENWVKVPSGRNIAPGSIPDVVIVNHTQSGDWGSHQYPAPGDVSGDKRIEISASGCTNASQAARMSITEKNLQVYQPFQWNNGIADGTAAGIEPGDVFFFDDDVLTMQAARALPPVTWLTNGHIAIDCREYDPSANSLETEADDTPPSVDPGWNTTPPDEPTAATQTFVEYGDWDIWSLLPDPNDMTSTTGWTSTGNTWGTLSYETGPPDYTEFELLSSGSLLSSNQEYAGTFTNGEKYLICGEIQTSNEPIVQIGLTNGMQLGWFSIVRGENISTWTTFAGVVTCPATSCYFFINGQNRVGATAAGNFKIRRLRCVPLMLKPSISLAERWEWTEAATSGDTVKKYELYEADTADFVIQQTPEGNAALEATILSPGLIGPTLTWIGNDKLIETAMRAVAPNGRTSPFPTPTQAWEEVAFGDTLDSYRANDLLDTVRIGDITNADYVEISKAGHLTLVGDATVWEDLRFPATAIGRRGNSDPDWVQVADDGSSSVGVWALGFSDTTDEEVYCAVQLPHEWKEGSSITPHVHWMPPTGTGTLEKGVTWALEYSWANIGMVDGSGTPVVFADTTTITVSDTGIMTAKEHRMVSFDPITATGKTLSSMLMCRLFRDVSDADDDYGDDAVLLEFDIHYEIDSLGSNTISSK